MKIATWNVNSLKVRLPHVLDWLAVSDADILCLQETKLTDENFPADEIKAAGYHVTYSGQKTYNGVAIISKREASDVITDVQGLDDPQRRDLGERGRAAVEDHFTMQHMGRRIATIVEDVCHDV